MKIEHPPHTVKLRNVTLPQDAAAFMEVVGRPMTRIKIAQHGDVFELHWPWPNREATPQSADALREWLEESGVDTRAANGFDATAWTPPMFFRAGSGRPVDLQELHGKAGGNGTVFLCLNGPSFDKKTRELLANRPPGVMAFGVNNGAHEFRPNLWACVDAPERFMGSIWEDGRVVKFVPEAMARKEVGGMEDRSLTPKSFPNVYTYKRNEQFDAGRWLTERTINWGNHKNHGGGRSVMLVALRVSILLGFRRIYLVGCDFEMSEKKKYWFDEDRTKQAIKNNNTSYEIMRGYFDGLREQFDTAGIEVWNCNEDSKLMAFPFADLGKAIERAAVDVSGSTRGMYRNQRNQRPQ